MLKNEMMLSYVVVQMYSPLGDTITRMTGVPRFCPQTAWPALLNR